MNLYIIDIIGTHSGTHYYNRSFWEILKTKFSQVKVISNYKANDCDSVKLFLNYYSGNLIVKILRFFVTLFRFKFFVLKNRKSAFIFQSFGNAYEILFIIILIAGRKTVIDVHEVVSLINKGPFVSKLRKIAIHLIYRYFADIVIVHSDRALEMVKDSGFRKPVLFVPHFSYIHEDEEFPERVGEEVKALIDENEKRVNVLFFGQIRESKGLEHVVSLAYRLIESELVKSVNLIIAGNDPHSLVAKHLARRNLHSLDGISVLLKFFNNSEMNYLFRKSDFIFLPYTEITQSGVMEMAIKYKVPVVTSALPYFRDFLTQFPSFGTSINHTEPEGFFNFFEKLNYRSNPKYYKSEDIERFNAYKNTDDFVARLSSQLAEI